MKTHVIKVHKGNKIKWILIFSLSLFSAWFQKTSSNWKEKLEMDLPDKSGKPDFEKKINKMSKNTLKNIKSIECSNTVIRFQCSYYQTRYWKQ